MYKIYKYTFPNGKIYVGKTKTNIEQRAGSNGCRYGDNTLVGRAIRKYGWINVKKEILLDNLSESEANKKEREIIRELDANNRLCGYNLTKGGDGGTVVHRVVSKETREKIGRKNSVSLKGRKLPDEVKAKISKANMGHEVSEETREKIRLANTGKTHSVEARKKIAEANKNRSSETLEKMSISLRKSGKERAEKRLNTLYSKYPDGWEQTPESNKKRSDALKGRSKSEETKQKMRKPKSPEAKENMRIAQKRSHEARKLGLTYKEYLERIEGK